MYGFFDHSRFSKTRANTDKDSLSSYGGGLKLFTDFDFILGLEAGVPNTKNIMVNGINVKNETRYNFTLNKSFNW